MTLVRLSTLALIVFCLSLLIGANAIAADKPCADDIAKFCKDVKRGGGAIQKCLKEHEAELSPACKDKIAATIEKPKPCAQDAAKFCKDVKEEKGALAKCLKEHEAELSPACKDNISKAMEKRKK